MTDAIFQQRGGSHQTSRSLFVCLSASEFKRQETKLAQQPLLSLSPHPTPKPPQKILGPSLAVIVPSCQTVDHNEEEDSNRSLRPELSFTFANEQYVVVAEAHGTLAAEAPDLVDTHAVGTDSGDLSTLVDVCTNTQQRLSLSGVTSSGTSLTCVCNRQVPASSPIGFPVWMSMMKPGAWLPHSSWYSAGDQERGEFSERKKQVKKEKTRDYVCSTGM